MYSLPITKKPLKGEINIPGDKSISHRAIMFASLAKGKTSIQNFLEGEDCLRTVSIFRQFGVEIDVNQDKVVVDSPGYEQFKEPTEPLYFGNSGTTARLMLGILAGLPFHTVAYGDPHLTNRPMNRVVVPLRKMGANIDGRGKDGSLLPLAIRGSALKGISYAIPMKSAQVKSALLLAGLFASEKTELTEKALTRNHTELMMQYYGIALETHDLTVSMTSGNKLFAKDIVVPGDISSAAFILTAGAIVPNSDLLLKNVGLNETRSGILDVLKQMKASLSFLNKHALNGELVGDIRIQQSQLQAITIEGDMIPRLIDEIPVIALLATQAEGKTIIKDAEELRVKETDRIKAIVETLTTLGAKVEEKDDGMIIYGKTPLKGGRIKSYFDHRMAMMGSVASLISDTSIEIDEVESIKISYPRFFDDLKRIMDK